MNTPKRHHYVPQLHLNGFANEAGKLYVYDRHRNKIRNETSKNIGAISHYYTVKKNGINDVAIERWLSDLESNITPILSSLINGNQVDSLELQDLHFFLAIQTTRVPAYRKSVEDYYSDMSRRLLDAFMLAGPKKWGDNTINEILKNESDRSFTPEQLVSFYKDNKHRIKPVISPNVSLKQMIDSATSIMPYLSQYNRLHLYNISDSSEFITSDIPVMSYNYRDSTYAPGASRTGLKGIALNMVLDRKNLIVLSDNGPVMTVSHTTHSQVMAHNCYLASCSYDFIASGNETVLKDVINITKLANKPPDVMFK